jgi:hypothetical protein
LKNFFIIKKHPLVKETFMERRQIVAAIVKIANQLDEMGMYSEANELTKVAQAAGNKILEGFGNIYEGVSRGVGGLARDTGKALKGTYDATKQGVSDVGEVLDNMGAESGYNLGRGQREFEMGYADLSDQSIDGSMEVLRDYIAQNNKEGLSQLANALYARMQAKVNMIQKRPGAQTTSAKNEINRLKAKQVQVMKLRDHFKRGSGATMDNRSNVGQFGTPSPEIVAFVSNRAKSNNLTKAQIYDMAVAERDENFANNVASYLTGQEIST